MVYLGDFPTGATVYVPFHTFDSSGASVTLTGLATSDLEIYRDGSATQRASDSGYALLDTDGIDFDSITGIHAFSIDLSDNTDSGFFAAGSDYWIVVSSVTVDGQTVNFVAATFSIENRWPSAANNADAVWTEAIADHSGTSGSTAEALSNATAPTAAAVADAVWDETMSDHTTSGSTGSKLNSITAGSVTYSGPVDPVTGNVTVIIGDDYSATDEAEGEWTSSNWADLTSAQSITLVVERGNADGTDFSTSITAPTTGSGSQIIRMELTSAQTEDLAEGTKPFQIEAVLASGRIRTLVEARWTSKDDIA